MKRFVVLAFVASGQFVHAQQLTAPLQPTDPLAPVPRVQYESAFTRYTPFAEQDPVEWKKVNEEVAQAGGHVKMFGGAHAGHGVPKQDTTPQPASGKPAAPKAEAVGQQPAHGTPQSPPDSHKGH